MSTNTPLDLPGQRRFLFSEYFADLYLGEVREVLSRWNGPTFVRLRFTDLVIDVPPEVATRRIFGTAAEAAAFLDRQKTTV